MFALQLSYRTHTQYNYAGKAGLIWSAFRPSDDAVAYRYNIPQQMGRAVALGQLAILARDGYKDFALAQQAAVVSLCATWHYAVRPLLRF